MPISATGNKAPWRRHAGFTLVELLVVVALMGLLSTVVVLTWPDPDPASLTDARRFAADARQAREAAIVNGRPLGLAVDQRGWTVLRAASDGWVPVADMRPGRWTDGVRASHDGPRPPDRAPGAAPPPVVPALRFDPVGLATPVIVRVEDRGGRVSVAVDAAGRIILSDAGGTR